MPENEVRLEGGEIQPSVLEQARYAITTAHLQIEAEERIRQDVDERNGFVQVLAPAGLAGVAIGAVVYKAANEAWMDEVVETAGLGVGFTGGVVILAAGAHCIKNVANKRKLRRLEIT